MTQAAADGRAAQRSSPAAFPDLQSHRIAGLAGTSVVVTGAASGVGLATSLLAARSGARVVAGDWNSRALGDLAVAAAAEGLDIECRPLDVSDPAGVGALMASTVGAAPLWGVVSCAAIAPETGFLDLPLEEWNRVLAVNLTGSFLVAREAASILVRQGGGGSIVNVTAGNAVTGSPRRAHYTAAKAGLNALTKTMAHELGPHAIRVNAVAPGAVDTPLARSIVAPEVAAERATHYPIARMGVPDDLAATIGFLLSRLSPWMTGQVIHVNGGMIMC
jgi:NAD(P)-dependent dehydrogenase (short-subunit alcohol dehydrogenase family)